MPVWIRSSLTCSDFGCTLSCFKIAGQNSDNLEVSKVYRGLWNNKRKKKQSYIHRLFLECVLKFQDLSLSFQEFIYIDLSYPFLTS